MAKKFMKNLFGRGKNAQLIGQIVLILLIILAVQLLYPILKKHFNIFEGLENGKEFVFFHMNGCGHCNNMKPEWEKFTGATSFTTRSVEMSESPDEINKFGIQSYPTLLLLENGEKVKEFKGERTAEAFEEFVKNE